MIIFKKIIIKNFLSVGNSEIEIDLNSCKLKAFSGISGSGKSLVLDALSYVLYNKPYRNIKKGQLVNSLNSRDLLVKLWFSIGSDEYLIKRGIKDDIYEIIKNDSPLNIESSNSNQEYLEFIIGMNHKTFKQIVVLGASDFTSFMNLKPSERRSLIEKLLDIEVFAIMNRNILEDIKQNKIDLASKQKDIDSINKQIESQKRNIESNLEDMEKVKTNHDADIQIYKEKIEDLKSKIKVLPPTPAAELEKFTTASNDLSIKLNELNNRYSELEKRRKYYTDTTTCKTCNQTIDQEIKDQVLAECESEIKKNRENHDKIFKGSQKVKTQIVKLKTTIEKINEMARSNNQLQTSISGYESRIDHLNRPVNLEVFEKRKIQINSTIDNLNSDLEKETNSFNAIAKKRDVLLMAKEVIGDSGVKSHIIDQYVPLINKHMNIFLNAMDFFVTFEIDSEFNETIKSRGRDDFSYASFSEGEKQRIDLAILLTLRRISETKNSLSTNLLVLDEVVDSYLNLEATENVLEMFRKNFDSDSNILVISHKEDILSRFDEVVYFKKENNFTLIEK